jgi:cell division protein FtsL
MRTLNAILLMMTMVGLVAVYALKYRAEGAAGELVETQTRIERKTEILSTLKADWTYLNQPSSIEPIVVRHAEALDVAPAEAEQYAGVEAIDALPMRPATEPDSAALTALLEALDAGFDPATGTPIGD